MSSRARVGEKVRGGCGFRSLMKQKKGKFALSFASPEKESIFFIYEVITWEKRKKSLLITTNTTHTTYL